MQNPNPLFSHFRQPAVFLKLPSGGKYYAPDAINLSATGEIGIMPMTAKDEIMLRTPDALMNGQGVVNVIQSCCPNIINAWGMPTIDVDAILIGIRIATYGEAMDIDSKCMHCKHENRHQISLNTSLLRIKSPDYSQTIIDNGLKIKLKPLNYYQSNQNNILNFEEQKLLDVLNSDNIDPETRKLQFDEHLKKIIGINIRSLSQGTESITTQDGVTVTDTHFIEEFYTNCPNTTIKNVQKKLKEFADQVALPPARVQCESCEKEYNVAITFDYANFFEPLS